MTISLEKISDDFGRFWTAINAAGNFSAALQELNIKHNSRVELNEFWQQRKVCQRILGKLVRVATQFPRYLREV